MRLLLLALLLWAAAVSATGAVTVEDSGGPRSFDGVPERPVALSWALAEQLLELGVTPAGMADPQGYRTWVGRPALPEGIADLGLRQEPNVEAIAALSPDVILISDDQKAFAPVLEKIAPVLHFDAFSAEHDNFAKAREIFLTLGRLFGREDRAWEKLTELDARLEALAGKLDARFGGAPPPVAVVRFIDAARVALHGANAMPSYALEALGLKNAIDLPPTTWGITMKPVRALGGIEKGVVLYLEPFAQKDEVFSQPLWRAMSFVREGRCTGLPASWTYGGAMSVGYLAEAIAEALLRMEAK